MLQSVDRKFERRRVQWFTHEILCGHDNLKIIVVSDGDSIKSESEKLVSDELSKGAGGQLAEEGDDLMPNGCIGEFLQRMPALISSKSCVRAAQSSIILCAKQCVGPGFRRRISRDQKSSSRPRPAHWRTRSEPDW